MEFIFSKCIFYYSSDITPRIHKSVEKGRIMNICTHNKLLCLDIENPMTYITENVSYPLSKLIYPKKIQIYISKIIIFEMFFLFTDYFC